jgi:hypothetical protein
VPPHAQRDIDTTTWVQSRTCARRTPNALLLLPLASTDDTPVALTGTAVAVWDTFASPRTVLDATEELRTTFAGEPATIVASVHDLVSRLVAVGALEAAP